MINSYEKLERNYMFEENTKTWEQHLKILSEVKEADAEVIPYPEHDVLFFKGRLDDYINEIQDIMLACNNQLLRIERDYGKNALQRAMSKWDRKIEMYSEVKYKED